MPTLTAEQQAVAIIADLSNLDAAGLALDTDLVEGAGLDSLDLVELVMQIDEVFDIEIPDETAEKWKTVGDVTRYVAGRRVK